jgi:two-component system sensor histidine kinase KdpD
VERRFGEPAVLSFSLYVEREQVNALGASARIQDLVRRHGYLAATASIIAATLLFMPFRHALGSEQWGWPYLLVLGFVAGTAGVGPGILSAVLAFFAWNFFFIKPYHTLFVADRGDLVHLGAFLFVGIAIGLQTGRLREREVVAQREERHAASLSRLSASLVSETTAVGIAEAAREELTAVVRASAADLWVPGGDGGLIAVAGTGARTPPDDVAQRWEVASRDPSLGDELTIEVATSAAADEHPRYRIVVPLISVQSAEGVLEALVDEQPDRSRRQFILSLAHLLAASLQSQRLNAIAMHAAAGREAERLRSAMVSSVSHELKTPLASITAAVTDLLEPDIQRNADAVQQKLRDVNEDLHRLDDAIADLLDVSRLEAQAWEPRPTDFEVGELVGSVVSRMPRTARERIRYAIPEDLPMLHLDFVQLSRALHHVLGNALEYSEGPVTVGAEADGQFVIWVGDEGPGIPDAEKPLVFDKFYRGAAGRSQRSSTGLGLSITREIVRANGGEVAIRDARPHGTKLLLSLPLEGRP